jgi:large subunit ribosomal protein L3
MIPFIIGKKVGMTQIFSKDGRVIPVTLVACLDCAVSQLKSEEKDGYNAIQVAAGRKKKVNKPLLGHLQRAGLSSAEMLAEFKTEMIKGIKLGEKITPEVFTPGDKVKITGISKGKGFQGVIKRHGFKRGPETHGSDHHRAPGSIGSMFPQHVFKGKKLPGRMGGEQVTLLSYVVDVDPQKKCLFIKGAIPGANGSRVLIRKV